MKYIYIYQTPSAKSEGAIKIGEAIDVDRRIRQQVNTAAALLPEEVSYELIYKTPAVTDLLTVIRDYDVHRALEAKGYQKHTIRLGDNTLKSRTEWFHIEVEKVIHLIEQMKKGVPIAQIDIDRYNDFPMRPEQQEAVRATREFFSRRTSGTHEMLWNAKMRFGKTFTAYQLARAMDFSTVLVMTYKPAVEDAWRTDLETHVDFKDYVFLRGDSLADVDRFRASGKKVVAFASYQDLLGKEADGSEIKRRHRKLFETHWELVIIDEFHYGTSTEKAMEILANQVEGGLGDPEKLKKEVLAEEDTTPEDERESTVVDSLAKQVKSDFRLFLSGTPFQAIADGRFTQDAIFNWTYLDEQRAKWEWDERHPEDLESNPYRDLPQIQMYLYKVSAELIEAGLQDAKDEFSLNHFFKAKNRKEFVHADAVRKWLDLISGVRPHQAIEDEIEDETDESVIHYPFDPNGVLSSELDHTLWYLNRVDSAYALKAALENHPVFSRYHIVLAAGSKAGSGLEAVKPVREAIREHERTITLSVGKLTTGVSIPEWKGVVFLRDISSPENYFQTAFRAQTPYKDPTTGKRKERCFVFDFSPNRSLRLLTTYSEKLTADRHLTTSEQRISEFIRFLPVLKVAGNSMVEMDAREVLTFDLNGVDAKGLGKRFIEKRNIVVTSDVIEAINACQETQEQCQNILDRIKMFRKHTGASDTEMDNADADVISLDVNEKRIKSLRTKRALSNEDDPVVDQEIRRAEAEQRKQREKVRELLKTLLSRIPLFMYLTDATEENLEQVLVDTGDDLFRKATGITVEDFRFLVELGLLKVDSIDGYVLKFVQLENQNFEAFNTIEPDADASNGRAYRMSRPQ